MRLLLTLALLTATALAHPGIGVVVDKAGNVYYTDLKQVWRLAPDGTKTVVVPNVHTHELHLEADGTLYGEHVTYTGPQDGSGKYHFRVWKRTADGRVADVVPLTEGFRTHHSFVRDAAGNSFIAGEGEGDTKRNFVRRVDSRGRSTRLAGGGPASADGAGLAAGFRNIRWMAIGRDQKVYVIDGQALRRVDPATGTVATLVRDLSKFSPDPLQRGSGHALMGLTADTQGNVYVACHTCACVKKVGRDGRVTIFSRSTGGWAPTGVALSPAGDKAWVLEWKAVSDVRVRVVGLRR